MGCSHSQDDSSPEAPASDASQKKKQCPYHTSTTATATTNNNANSSTHSTLTATVPPSERTTDLKELIRQLHSQLAARAHAAEAKPVVSDRQGTASGGNHPTSPSKQTPTSDSGAGFSFEIPSAVSGLDEEERRLLLQCLQQSEALGANPNGPAKRASKSNEPSHERLLNNWVKVEKINGPDNVFGEDLYRNIRELDPSTQVFFHNVDVRLQAKTFHRMISTSFHLLCRNETESLVPELMSLGARHAQWGVTAAHLEVVKVATIKSLKKFLGAELTPELQRDYENAVGTINRLLAFGMTTEEGLNFTRRFEKSCDNHVQRLWRKVELVEAKARKEQQKELDAMARSRRESGAVSPSASTHHHPVFHQTSGGGGCPMMLHSVNSPATIESPHQSPRSPGQVAHQPSSGGGGGGTDLVANSTPNANRSIIGPPPKHSSESSRHAPSLAMIQASSRSGGGGHHGALLLSGESSPPSTSNDLPSPFVALWYNIAQGQHDELTEFTALTDGRASRRVFQFLSEVILELDDRPRCMTMLKECGLRHVAYGVEGRLFKLLVPAFPVACERFMEDHHISLNIVDTDRLKRFITFVTEMMAVGLEEAEKGGMLVSAPRSPPYALVFTDIEQSTKLWALHPEAMGAAIAKHHSIIRHLVDLYRGYEVKTVGDAFMIAFQSIVDATAFAFCVQVELLAQTPSAMGFEMLEETEGAGGDWDVATLRVRMGIHECGPDCAPVFDPVYHRYDYYGTDVNVASRIQSKACGGQILMSMDDFRALRAHREYTRPDMPDFRREVKRKANFLLTATGSPPVAPPTSSADDFSDRLDPNFNAFDSPDSPLPPNSNYSNQTKSGDSVSPNSAALPAPTGDALGSRRKSFTMQRVLSLHDCLTYSIFGKDVPMKGVDGGLTLVSVLPQCLDGRKFVLKKEQDAAKKD